MTQDASPLPLDLAGAPPAPPSDAPLATPPVPSGPGPKGLTGFGRFAHFDWFDRGVLALAFTFLAAFFPWFEALHTPNELTRVYLASALIEDGTVAIDHQIEKYGGITDISKKDGRTFADKAPGTSFLAAPFIGLYDALSSEPTLAGKVRVTRLVVATFPTFFLLILLMRFLRERLADRRLAALLVLAYALGSVATPYAELAFGHQLAACLLFATFYAARRATASGANGSWWWSVATGACAAGAVVDEYPNVFLLVPIAVFFLVRVRARPKPILLAIAGAAPLMGALFAYHTAAFGGPFENGYGYIASSYAAYHKQGVFGVLYPKPTTFALSFLSPQRGLWFFAPWLALAVPGLIRFRRDGADGWLHLAMVVVGALFVSSLVFPEGGWSVSQRYLTPIVPFMLLPIGRLVVSVGRLPWMRSVFVGLALPALAMCGMSAVTWPHYIESLRNPFFQIGWPLFRDGWVPPSAFAVIGISAWLAAILMLGGAACILLWDLVRHDSDRAERTDGRPDGPKRWRRFLWPLGAVAIAATYVALARLPGRDQDVTQDRQWIESVYTRDPATARH